MSLCTNTTHSFEPALTLKNQGSCIEHKPQGKCSFQNIWSCFEVYWVCVLEFTVSLPLSVEMKRLWVHCNTRPWRSLTKNLHWNQQMLITFAWKTVRELVNTLSRPRNTFFTHNTERAEVHRPLFSSLKVHLCLCVGSFMAGFMVYCNLL